MSDPGDGPDREACDAKEQTQDTGSDATALVPVEPVEVVVRREDESGTDPAVPEAEGPHFEGELDQNPEQDPDAPFRKLRPLRRAFLRAYMHHLTLAEAARTVGCTVQAHHKWAKTDPDYQAALEVADQVVNARWEEVLAKRVQAGLRDARYNAKGELLDYRLREDSRLLSLMLQARMPQKYGRDPGGGQAVQVNVVFRDE